MHKVTPQKKNRPNLKIDVNAKRVDNPNYYFEPVQRPVEVYWKGMRDDSGRRHSPRHIEEIEQRHSKSI